MFGRFARFARNARVGTRGVATAARSANNGRLVTLALGGVFGCTAAYVLSNTFAQDETAEESNVAFADAKVPFYGVPGTRHERTFIAIKPDGVQRGLVGEVIKRFEAKGYKLVAIKVVTPTEEFAKKHYHDLAGKPFFNGLIAYFSSGPVIAMVWEGRGSILGGRKLVGATRPDAAEMGTVRGDYAIDTGRNIIHGSDGPDSAKDEISLWFKESEVASYETENAKWVYEGK